MAHETILIVDDDRELMEVMSRIIRSQEYECQVAYDGQEAYNLIKEHKYDVVISDINIPSMSGLELMDCVHEVSPHTRFLIITGYDREYPFDRVISAGAQDFIKKPFTSKEFSRKLTRILTERRMDETNKVLAQKQAKVDMRLSLLIEVGNVLGSELNLERLFHLIIHKVTEVMFAQRTSLYVIDFERSEIWTKVAEGIDQIRLPIGQGICGHVAKTGETVNVKDAWRVPFFKREFDEQHHFRTRSVLCMPVKNRDGVNIAVLQVLNKKEKDAFDTDDEQLLSALAAQVGIALENSLLHEELRLSFEASIQTLSAVVDAKHHFTAGHSQRVTDYSLMIGRKMNMNNEEIEALKFAALLHDIGKIGIPDTVLLKSGRFTDEERKSMNTHAVKTKAILENFRFPRNLKNIPAMAAHHHEKVNGKGYPFGLAGEQLSIGAKIIALADVFDALTSRRDYPKYTGTSTAVNCDPLPLSKVLDIIREDTGEHFDPGVVDAFFSCLPQILAEKKGTHFSAEYIAETLKKLSA